jgi:hypothetical protein
MDGHGFEERGSRRAPSPPQSGFGPYPKPRVSVQWDVDANDQLRLALSREVGQLDFEDFVASASLETDRISAGNRRRQHRTYPGPPHLAHPLGHPDRTHRRTQNRIPLRRDQAEWMGWTLFVEKEVGTRWRVRAEATDLFGRGFDETREKFDGRRSIEPLEEMERRRRHSPGFVSLSFRRSTGG